MIQSQAKIFFTTSFLVSSGPCTALDVETLCREASAASFEQTMTFVVSGGETCANTICLNEPAVLGDRVYVEISQSSAESEMVPVIQELSEEATNVISSVTGVSFQSKFEDAQSFLFLILVSPETIRELAAGKMEGVDQHGFNSFVAPALRISKCAGIASHFSEAGHRKIYRGVIFVPDTVKSKDAMRSCVFEEIMNVSGLLRDPPGSASLFDNGNYQIVDGLMTYSDSTLAMLQIHYDISKGKYRDVAQFLNLECREP